MRKIIFIVFTLMSFQGFSASNQTGTIPAARLGTVPVTSGGTGQTSYTTNHVMYFDGTNIVGSSNLTFITDTLIPAKIAATTFTGNLTISTKNIVTDTTTGTKIGTGTTQKLGFFNSTPIVQPSGDIATALSNLGLVASPTTSAIVTSGSAPTVSACGTSPTISGNDSSGAVTIGTGGIVSACTLSFSATKSSTPHCFTNDRTEIVAVSVSAVSTTAFTISKTTPFAASSVIDYFCVQ